LHSGGARCETRGGSVLTDDGKVGKPVGVEELQQLDAADLRHQDVGENEVHAEALRRLQHLHRLPAVSR
jgi:hypothetical protein